MGGQRVKEWRFPFTEFPATWSAAVLTRENAACEASLLALPAWGAPWPLPGGAEVVEDCLCEQVAAEESLLKRGEAAGFSGADSSWIFTFSLDSPGGQASSFCHSFVLLLVADSYWGAA